ncbi:hypothetical protein ALC57_05142 [Trachymyrmex cornetzi]|uniref:Nuclease HARBI1 n=1 Tax=Trachymyrmex cornetzi TaxID=471704 RepID=A0A151JBG7_9HYME|nr:hypothetical protein ALC57_05142 [Trachymyrmex cornetzi]
MPQINNLLLHVIAQVQLRRLLIVALLISKKRNYRKKRFWTSQFLSQRKTHGAYYTTIPTLLRNADLFSNYCRMSKTQFEDLLTLIGSQITKQTFIREPISPDQRLFLTLRYLASGDSMMSLKYQYYVAQSTITNIIKETCNVLWSMLMPIVLKVPTHDTWKQIAKKFELNCHFPHCIGAVDGKHVVIQHKFHLKNLEFCIKTLLKNGYPIDLMFREVQKRINKLYTTKLINLNNDDCDIHDNIDDTLGKKLFVVPYIPKITNTVISNLNKDVFTIGIRCMNKLNRFVKVHKDKTDTMSKNNVVYKVTCKDCEASYVGQTKRKLSTRVKEHEYNIRENPSNYSVLTNHMLEFNHSFDWKNVRVMDIESHYNKRLISEMLFIKEQHNDINAQKDTEKLSKSYFCLLDNDPVVVCCCVFCVVCCVLCVTKIIKLSYFKFNVTQYYYSGSFNLFSTVTEAACALERFIQFTQQLLIL